MGAAVLPALKIGGMIGGGLLGRRSAQGVTRRSPEERAALGQASGVGGMLRKQAGELFGIGRSALRGAAGFFGPLVSGNRAQLLSATAPERAEIGNVFGGARRGIAASTPRGGVRDLALAETSRTEAGELGLLAPRMRTGAATALGNLGLGAAGTGVQAGGAAGGIFSNLLGLGQRSRLAGADIQRQAGTDIGSFLFQLLQSFQPGKPGQSGQMQTRSLPFPSR